MDDSDGSMDDSDGSMDDSDGSMDDTDDCRDCIVGFKPRVARPNLFHRNGLEGALSKFRETEHEAA
jgi:hypothetical protein